jgi:hypothetical protein
MLTTKIVFEYCLKQKNIINFKEITGAVEII